MTLEEVVKTLDETAEKIKKLTLDELKKLFWLDIREDYFDDDAVVTTRLKAQCKACGFEIYAENISELIDEMLEHIIREITAMKWGLMHLDFLASKKLKKEVDSDGQA